MSRCPPEASNHNAARASHVGCKAAKSCVYRHRSRLAVSMHAVEATESDSRGEPGVLHAVSREARVWGALVGAAGVPPGRGGSRV